MYAGDYSGMESGLRVFMRWVSLLLTIPVVLYSASGFLSPPGAISSAAT